MSYLLPRQPFVLLENSRDADGLSYLYEQPEEVIVCDTPDGIDAAFDAIDEANKAGLHVVGWISYEAGYALEPRLRPLMPDTRNEPLIWMGLFPRRQVLARGDVEAWWAEHTLARDGALSSLSFDIDRDTYIRAVQTIKDYLAAGDIYQANLTLMGVGEVSGDPLALHKALRDAQPVSFGAFVSTGDWCVSSHSPELFLMRRGDHVTVKPMKGTAARGRTFAEDDAAAQALRDDTKSRAENLMIVDLERNDLSRIAVPGSVAAAPMFDVERYPTLLQMTSTVTGTVPDALTASALLRAMFPCGSVTGAPKIWAMEILANLETAPRGVYTGAIGAFAPDGDAALSVPIRTLVVDRDGKARFGIGSGLVADSDPDAEYEECQLKRRFLTDPQARPALVETILWRHEGGFWLLPEHQARLEASASYFGYPFDPEEFSNALDDLAAYFTSNTSPSNTSRPFSRRVRLLLSASGAISITATPFDPEAGRTGPNGDPPCITLSPDPVQSGDTFLFHKTTRRARYDQALQWAWKNGYWDVLFHNEEGALTEGARSTLFLEKNGELLTPPLSSGVLPGTFRAHLLAGNITKVREEILSEADLKAADQVFMANALHGLVPVIVKQKPFP